MNKKIIDSLLKNQKLNKPWTEQEVKDLIELKNAGVTFTTIKKNLTLLEEYFPGRTENAIRSRYQNL